MSSKIVAPSRRVMADSIPVRLDEDARHLIDLAARAEGMKLSTFLRRSAVEAARRRLLQEGGTQ